VSEEQTPTPTPEDVEAHLLKEALAAGTASAAIFAGTSQAASYPGPLPPGTEDVAAELALIPANSDRAVQQKKATKKSAKAKKVAKPTPADRRAQPE
jgi:hypothetical protein